MNYIFEVCRTQENVTYAKESMSRVPDQLKKLQVDDPEQSEFYRQFRKMPEKLGLDAGK
jgi:hypothetical protein